MISLKWKIIISRCLSYFSWFGWIQPTPFSYRSTLTTPSRSPCLLSRCCPLALCLCGSSAPEWTPQSPLSASNARSFPKIISALSRKRKITPSSLPFPQVQFKNYNLYIFQPKLHWLSLFIIDSKHKFYLNIKFYFFFLLSRMNISESINFYFPMIIFWGSTFTWQNEGYFQWKVAIIPVFLFLYNFSWGDWTFSTSWVSKIRWLPFGICRDQWIWVSWSSINTIQWIGLRIYSFLPWCEFHINFMLLIAWWNLPIFLRV